MTAPTLNFTRSEYDARLAKGTGLFLGKTSPGLPAAWSAAGIRI
jgi:hypothetical protein